MEQWQQEVEVRKSRLDSASARHETAVAELEKLKAQAEAALAESGQAAYDAFHEVRHRAWSDSIETFLDRATAQSKYNTAVQAWERAGGAVGHGSQSVLSEKLRQLGLQGAMEQ